MFWGILLFILLVFAAIGIASSEAEQSRVAKMTPAQRKTHKEKKVEDSRTAIHGQKNEALLCPHCGEKGGVRTKPIDMKKGVSGAKATGALLTGGVSLLATGLSRKEKLTKTHCDLCQSDWIF